MTRILRTKLKPTISTPSASQGKAAEASSTSGPSNAFDCAPLGMSGGGSEELEAAPASAAYAKLEPQPPKRKARSCGSLLCDRWTRVCASVAVLKTKVSLGGKGNRSRTVL